MARTTSVAPHVATGGLPLPSATSGDPSWSGTGSVTMTSTPAPGVCNGQGVADITLNAVGSSVSGTLTSTLESVAAACSGNFPMSTIVVDISGSLSGNVLSMSTPQGDTLHGSFSNGQLSLALVPGGTIGGGGSCVEYCNTVFQYTFSGSGDLFASSGLFDFSSLPPEDLAAGAIAGVGGLAALGMAAGGSLPGRGSLGSSSPSYGTKGGRAFGKSSSVPPGVNPAAWRSAIPYTATPAPPPTIEPPMPLLAPDGMGQPLGGVGAHYGLPDCWPGHPPPKSMEDTSNAVCPIHHCLVHPALYVAGPGPSDERGLRWQCPVGPHWVFCGGG
jgi:hypothetical protein